MKNQKLVMLGAHMGMLGTNYSLHCDFADNRRISFATNSIPFIRELKNRLTIYGLDVNIKV